jgi:hypothetical protein
MSGLLGLRASPSCAASLLSCIVAAAVLPGRSAAGELAAGAPAVFAAGPDTLFLAEREDHSPAIAVDPATSHPVLVWVASAPDTNVSGRFDELALATYDGAAWTVQVLAGPGDFYTPGVLFAADGARWVTWAEHDGTDSQIRCRRDLGAVSQLFTLGDPLQPDLEPAICADDSGGVFVAWQGWRSTDYEILASAGGENGFAAPMLVSQCTNADREPAVTWGGGKAWIAWSSYQNMPYNLVLKTWDGAALSPAVQLTAYQRARAFTPDVAWDAQNNLLWVTSLFVNNGWSGYNQNEASIAADLGTPTVRAFDGTTLFAPAGVDSMSRYPLALMEGIGFERFVFPDGVLLADRWGSDVKVVPVAGRRAWFFHKQIGSLSATGTPQRYWGLVGTSFGGTTWSAPGAFVDLRTTFGWEGAAVAAAGDQLWIAWSADARSAPIAYGIYEIFGHDLNVVVQSVTVDTTDAGAPGLVSLGSPPAVNPCVTSPRPVFTIDDGGVTRMVLHGDMHRHSADVSWDGTSTDPLFKHTMFYSHDWLGHDFIMPSDHVQMYSKAMFSWVAKWATIYDSPMHRVFTGYERIMYGGAGGHQNVIYRDPAQFSEASTGLPANNGWEHVYSALQGIDAVSAPHTTAQAANVTKWEILAGGDPQNLPAPLRLVEVYQSARESFEYLGCPHQYTGTSTPADTGWVNVALALGMRLGMIASSDHTARAAYVSVLAESRSRDAIYQALYDRHCYGSSRSTRFNCDFRVNGALMGSEVESSGAPTLDVVVDGTTTLGTVSINKDGDPAWFSTTCVSADTTLSIVDTDPVVPGTSSYYYLRVYDGGNKLLWCSPVWVDFVQPTGVVSEGPDPGPLALEVHPNPSRGVVRFALRGLGASGGRLNVYDVSGRLVRRLDVPPGASERELAWDGRDAEGREIAPAVYFAVLQSRGATTSGRVLRLR